MLDALTLWMGHQPDRAGFGFRGNDDLDELARDLGVSANELRYLMSSVPDPLQLREMLKALGIDEASLRRAQPALLRTLQHRCAECAVAGRCRDSLDRKLAARDYEQFCPNAAVLTAFRPMHEGDFFS